MIKGSNHREDITMLNVHAPNRISKHTKKELIVLKLERKFMIITEDFTHKSMEQVHRNSVMN